MSEEEQGLKSLTIKLEMPQYERISELSDQLGVTKTAVIRKALSIALDEAMNRIVLERSFGEWLAIPKGERPPLSSFLVKNAGEETAESVIAEMNQRKPDEDWEVIDVP